MTAGRLEEADAQFREILALCDASLPADHYMAAIFRDNYGECLTKRKQFEAAEQTLLKSQAVIAKKFGEAHARTLKSKARLATLYSAWNKPDEAAKWK
jgi:serine/threonine-protein kinase